MQNKTWAKIIALLAVVLAAASLYVLYRRENDTVVEVYYAGQVQQVIDLTRVKESYVIDVETEGGHNTILVEPGRICVAEADCPDGICVQQGWLSDQAMPIVCMPHGLVISVRSGAAADGATR